MCHIFKNDRHLRRMTIFPSQENDITYISVCLYFVSQKSNKTFAINNCKVSIGTVTTEIGSQGDLAAISTKRSQLHAMCEGDRSVRRNLNKIDTNKAALL